MVVGVLRVKLAIRSAYSLKDRRRVLNSLKARLRNHFNVSVAEVGDRDMWQLAELGVAAVGMERSVVNGLLSAVVNAMRAGEAELVHYELEFY
jgi:uncharacterized protein